MTFDARLAPAAPSGGTQDPFARVRQELQDDLNQVLSSFLRVRDGVSNRIVACQRLQDALESLNMAVSIPARGRRGGVDVALLYRDPPIAFWTKDQQRVFRAGGGDALMTELANQFLGALCQRLPDLREGAMMAPPEIRRLSEHDARALVVDHANEAMSEFDALRLGWACAATAVDFQTFCLITITEQGKSQHDILRTLATRRDAEPIEWLA